MWKCLLPLYQAGKLSVLNKRGLRRELEKVMETCFCLLFPPLPTFFKAKHLPAPSVRLCYQPPDGAWSSLGNTADLLATVPLEETATLEGRIYGTSSPLSFSLFSSLLFPRLSPQMSKNFPSQSWQSHAPLLK